MEDQQDLPILAFCSRCGGEIYPGNRAWLVAGRWQCRDCARRDQSPPPEGAGP